MYCRIYGFFAGKVTFIATHNIIVNPKFKYDYFDEEYSRETLVKFSQHFMGLQLGL